MSWTVALALGALLVSAVVLYRSLAHGRRGNPELERLRRENERLQARLDRAERRLEIDPDAPHTHDEKDRP